MNKTILKAILLTVILSLLLGIAAGCGGKTEPGTPDVPAPAPDMPVPDTPDVPAPAPDMPVPDSADPNTPAADGPYTIDNIRDYVVGVDTPVELGDGSARPLINFDNAATTPALKPVMDEVDSKLEMYGSIGRGFHRSPTIRRTSTTTQGTRSLNSSEQIPSATPVSTSTTLPTA